MIEVSAGIITRPDGCVLVCKRGEGRKNAHLWEFPGGKREMGETAAQCLRRELLEELKLPVEGLREVYQDEAQGIHFTFLRGETACIPVLTEHEDAAFLPPRRLLGLSFCPADQEVARALALNAPPLRHFFWDFDGTLMNTYPLMVRVLVRGCASLGIALEETRALNLMKRTLWDACVTLGAENNVDAVAVLDAYNLAKQKADITCVQPIPGIPEALKALERLGGRHYLVTHREKKSALPMLAHAGLLNHFTDMVTGDMNFPRKPAPDSCRYLLKKHGIDPCTAVMIGDRPLDTAAGRGAGMLSCLLDTEGRFPDDDCELRTADARGLAGLLCPGAL